MSLSACVQQFSVSAGSYVAGLIVTRTAEGRLANYGWVGWNAAIFTLVAIYLVFKIRAVESGAAQTQ